MTTMPRLPKMPALKSLNKCACGCPRTTGNRFAPGHDSKLKGMRLRVEAGVWTKTPEGQPVDIDAQLDALAEFMGPSYAEATATEMRHDWSIEAWTERVEAADEAVNS